MKKRILKIIVLSLSVCFTQIASAGILDFLHDSILTKFSPAEVTSFKAAINESLNSSPDRKVITWHSDTSQLGGKILPKFSYTNDGVPCRRTLFLLSEKGQRKEHFRFDICKIDDSWGVMQSPISQFEKTELIELQEKLIVALNAVDVRQSTSWHNEDSGNSAILTTLTLEHNSCRDVAISLTAKNGRSSSGTYLFCKGKDNNWQRELSEK